MKQEVSGKVRCSQAQSLDRLGDQWSMLILRDALNGIKRFDEFEKSLRIAPSILTRRLAKLIEAGLLQRQQYSQRPPRFEYVLTLRGRDFQPVLVALLAFGTRHFAEGELAVTLVDTETGLDADPVIIDRVSGQQIAHPRFRSRAEIVREAKSGSKA